VNIFTTTIYHQTPQSQGNSDNPGSVLMEIKAERHKLVVFSAIYDRLKTALRDYDAENYI